MTVPSPPPSSPAPAGNPIRACAYLRKSDPRASRQVASIEDQRAALTAYASAHGLVVVEWFVDEQSGTAADARVDFQRMIATAQSSARTWSTVLVWDQSRFSRGGADETGHYRYLLREAGVALHFTAEPTADGMAGELLTPIRDVLNRDTVVKLSRDVLRGQMSRAAAGHVFGRRPPFGYDLAFFHGDRRVLVQRWTGRGPKSVVEADPEFLERFGAWSDTERARADRRLVPSTPARVAVLQEIFAAAASGASTLRIAQQLNAREAESPTGIGWQAPTVAALIRNVVFRGDLLWGASSEAKFHAVVKGRHAVLDRSGKRQRRAYSPSDGVLTIDAHEALVSRAEWAAAQPTKQPSRRRAPGGTGQRSVYLLSGLLECRCGRRMNGTSYPRRGGGRLRRYRCVRDLTGRGAPCPGGAIDGPALDAAVLEAVAAHLQRGSASVLASAALREAIATEVSRRAAPAHESRRPADFERKIATLSARIADHPDLADVLIPQLQRLRAEQSAAAASPAPPPRLDAPTMRKRALALCDDLVEALSSAELVERKTVLRQCIRGIEVDATTGTALLSLVPIEGDDHTAESIMGSDPFKLGVGPTMWPCGLFGARRWGGVW